MARQSEAVLEELLERVKNLEHQAELMKTVLIVKEPTSIPAAESYDGLRKQVVAGAAERRSHLSQLVQMAVAISRAGTIDDLARRVSEWMEQAGIATLAELPPGAQPGDVFEDIGGQGLEGPLDVVEPAFVDLQTNQLLRLGRARLRLESSPGEHLEPVPTGTTREGAS